jgi:hypothetical protein
MVVVIILAVVLVLILGVLAFLQLTDSSSLMAKRYGDSTTALYLAEGGMELTISYLKNDFENDPVPPPSWADGDINGTAAGPDTDDYYLLWQNSTTKARLKNVPGKADQVWVKSEATVNGIKRTVVQYIKIRDFSVWNTALFGGTGASGEAVNGNVYIHGSVHILGTGLASTDSAIDLKGGAAVGNNYEGIPSEFSGRIPPLSQVTFNGEEVESLNAEFRAKNGRVDLSGTATLGLFDVFGNSVKETMDGVYVDAGPYDGDDTTGTYYDGYGGNKGYINVRSDNGYATAYDLGDTVTFPSLSDPYGSSPSYTYKDYLGDNSYHVSEDILNSINSSTVSFSYSDPMGKGSISWDRTSETLTVNGIVTIDDGSDPDEISSISIGENDDPIEYTGRGTIFSGDVNVHGDLLSKRTFPTEDVLGFMAERNINLATGGGDAQLKIIGAFYAENEIVSAKQNEIAGTFVSNYFNMGTNVPKIYQVPELVNNLPPGMIGTGHNWRIITSLWHEE